MRRPRQLSTESQETNRLYDSFVNGIIYATDVGERERRRKSHRTRSGEQRPEDEPQLGGDCSPGDDAALLRLRLDPTPARILTPRRPLQIEIGRRRSSAPPLLLLDWPLLAIRCEASCISAKWGVWGAVSPDAKPIRCPDGRSNSAPCAPFCGNERPCEACWRRSKELFG
jgi:hypothetical protein